MDYSGYLDTAIAASMCYPQNMTFRTYLFDLDETLAESFMEPTPEITAQILALMTKAPVAILTGRDFRHVGEIFLSRIAASPDTGNFYALTESTARCLQYQGAKWEELYTCALTQDEKALVMHAIDEALEETHALDGLTVYGEHYRDKTAQVSFAMLGLDVPREIKYSWDPDNSRRRAMQEALARKLPAYEVLIGGATTIDVTKKGIDKTYGLNWLSKHLGIPPQDMVYVGDALYPGGNDYVLIQTGITTVPTSGPAETTQIINSFLSVAS